MRNIPVNTPLVEETDRQAVLGCLESGWLSSEGPQVPAFERAFAGAVARRHGVAVSSGTAALDIAIRALGIGPGDEVLLPSLTIISCARAIVESGATPVPIDCSEVDWNARLSDFETRLTPRTRAVMLVHLYGLCGDLAPILAWARARNLLVIEDASQALGLTYSGLPCGSFGDISIFSLYANKLVTTGEGGMLVCDDEALAVRCRSLRNLCFTAKRFWHEELGWNYRMTAMQAALGSSQIARIDRLVDMKRSMGLRYDQAFRDITVFTRPPVSTRWAENVYWVFAMVTAPDAPFSRDELLAKLEACGVGTRTFFYGLHQQPALRSRHYVEPIELPVTESLSARGFYLPSGLGLSSDDQQRVIDVVYDLVAART